MSTQTVAPPADLRTAAFAAIAQAAEEQPGLSVRLVAAKIMRDKTGLGLREVVPAIAWAIDHPEAEHLPVDSIVAFRSTVMIKRSMVDAIGGCWQAMVAGLDQTDWATNAEIDEHVQADGATVLRVGGGS